MGIASTTTIIPAGENSKSFGRLEQLCGWLLDEKIERDDCIIALGGGVIGDLTGFAAAIVRRGARFIQIPTTLLAQVDSSIGGKTAINAAQEKSHWGIFPARTGAGRHAGADHIAGAGTARRLCRNREIWRIG